ncbi:MAG: hypothetical protein FJ280_23050 [Planctomycetes bacterium]|nr:hypothetical protein [Planctomycetota bacterium]
MRTLKVIKDDKHAPAGFAFSVYENRLGPKASALAWFKTESDARLFSSAEQEIQELKRKLGDVKRSASSAYYRGLLVH